MTPEEIEQLWVGQEVTDGVQTLQVQKAIVLSLREDGDAAVILHAMSGGILLCLASEVSVKD